MPAYSYWILLADLLFALMALGIKIAGNDFNAFEILFYRAAFGVTCMGIIMCVKGIPFTTKHPLSHLKRCTFGTLCFYFEILALGLLPLNVVQSLEYASPLIFAGFMLIATLANRGKLEKPLFISILVGFLGVLLIVQPWESLGSVETKGVLLALIAAFLAACVNWYLRTLAIQREPNERTVFYFMLFSGIFGATGTTFFGGGFHFPIDSGPWLAICGVAVSALMAQVLVTLAWGYGHPLLNAVFQFSGILYGAIIGILALSEKISLLTLSGMILIFAAGLFSTLYLKKRK